MRSLSSSSRGSHVPSMNHWPLITGMRSCSAGHHNAYHIIQNVVLSTLTFLAPVMQPILCWLASLSVWTSQRCIRELKTDSSYQTLLLVVLILNAGLLSKIREWCVNMTVSHCWCHREGTLSWRYCAISVRKGLLNYRLNFSCSEPKSNGQAGKQLCYAVTNQQLILL